MLRVRRLSELGGDPPDSNTLYTDDDGILLVAGALGGGGGSGTSDTTEETQLQVLAAVESIDAKVPAETTPGFLPVDTLGTPVGCVPHAVTAASTSAALLPGTRRVSVDVGGVAAIIRINAAASVPASGVRLLDAIAVPKDSTKDFNVPANCTLHWVRNGAVDGTISITELA